MSLNNISLPSQLLADLYQNTLIQNTASAMPVKEDVVFLGENKKNILIVVNTKEAVYLPDNELTFLTTVLSACGLDLSHVAILNWYHQKQKVSSWVLEQLKPKQVLLLDVLPIEFGFASNALYTVQKSNGLQFVAAPSLSDIEGTKETKKQLWVVLKQLFFL